MTIQSGLRGTDRPWSGKRILAWVRFFRRLQPRCVVLCHSAVFHFNNACLAARLAGVANVVSVVYSTAAYPRPVKHSRHFRVIPGVGLWWHVLRTRIRLILGLSHKTLFASPWHARQFYKAYELSPERAWVVPHLGADAERFHPCQLSGNATRSEWGISSGHLVVSYVGRLDGEKGPDVLVEALGHLPRQLRRRIRVLLAGEGPLRQRLGSRIHQLGWRGSVRMLGYCNEPEKVFQASDIVVVPSLRECFGLSLVEAMASGAAVIASQVGGLAAILGDPEAQGAGILVPPRDPIALAQALAALAQAPATRRRMGQLARRLVCSKYCSDVVLALLEDLFMDRSTQLAYEARWSRTDQRPRPSESRTSPATNLFVHPGNDEPPALQTGSVFGGHPTDTSGTMDSC